MPGGVEVRRLVTAALGLVLLGPLACATTQEVPLACVEEEVQIYVDGRLLEEHPDVITLRTDRPHKLYFKREGGPPQLVVLEPGTDPEGRPRLVPSDPCVALVPVGLGRELTIEVEEGASD
jgi:hypothetical protein